MDQSYGENDTYTNTSKKLTSKTITIPTTSEKVVKTQEMTKESPFNHGGLQKMKLTSTFHLKPPLKAKIKNSQVLRLNQVSPSRGGGGLQNEQGTSNQSTRKGSHFSQLSQTQATAISKMGIKSAEFMIQKDSSSSNTKK